MLVAFHELRARRLHIVPHNLLPGLCPLTVSNGPTPEFRRLACAFEGVGLHHAKACSSVPVLV